MKNNIRLLSLSLLFFMLSNSAFSWGFWAHQRINRIAVFTLPKEMLGFYKNNIDYLTAHAVDADKRRFVSSTEAPRHFIDLDRYGSYPYDTIPRRWKDAVKRFGEDTLRGNGIVPWQITFTYHRLTEAFRNKDSFQILKLSADLGHYMADACVPLHTTQNYNGQLTGQTGIHTFWESRVPELSGEDYNYFVGKARYTDSVLSLVWQSVLESNKAVDSVLSFEKALSARFPEDKRYVFIIKDNKTVRSYTAEYVKAYSEMLDGQVERRMRRAILNTGSLWMSAWIDAGQPDLSGFTKKPSVPEETEQGNTSAGETWLGRPEE